MFVSKKQQKAKKAIEQARHSNTRHLNTGCTARAFLTENGLRRRISMRVFKQVSLFVWDQPVPVCPGSSPSPRFPRRHGVG